MSDFHFPDAKRFWSFSLDFYGRAGVAQALLALQDEADLDVNCMLLCCWAGMTGYGRLAPCEITALLRISDDWNAHIVSPLRAVRRALKQKQEALDAAAVLRRSVTDVEFEAERIEQTLLAGVLDRTPCAAPSLVDSRTNLEAYLKAKRGPLPPPLSRAFEYVVAALAEFKSP